MDDWLVKVSWLGKLVSVFWCVEMDFFSLECNGVPSNVLQWVYVLGVTLGSLYDSGLCSCIAEEFAWYVLFWSLLAFVWWLVLV